jgi:(R,R)-butanediol dehydrogenase/meso-butanediol dehydrogenase/diacetyl reductase
MWARSRRRESVARTLGASELITSGRDAGTQVVSALAGEPDVVFEATGAAGLISAAIDYIRSKGLVIGAGLCMQRDWFDPATALRKEVTLRYSMAYARRDFQNVITQLEHDPAEARSLITCRTSLQDLPAVFEGLRSPSSPECKVLVSPWID